MPKNPWLDTTKTSLSLIVGTFLSDYPLVDHSKLNGHTMRRVLAGELQIVKMGGRDKFELWPNKNFGTRLKTWNKRVTTPCVRIPPIRPPNPEKIISMRKEMRIKEILEYVEPRS